MRWLALIAILAIAFALWLYLVAVLWLVDRGCAAIRGG